MYWSIQKVSSYVNGSHESHALTPLDCFIRTNTFFIFNRVINHVIQEQTVLLETAKHWLLKAIVTMMQHVIWVLCTADTKLQYIIIM